MPLDKQGGPIYWKGCQITQFLFCFVFLFLFLFFFRMICSVFPAEPVSPTMPCRSHFSLTTLPQRCSCWGLVLPRASSWPEPAVLPWFQFYRNTKRYNVMELYSVALTKQYWLFITNTPIFIAIFTQWKYTVLVSLLRGTSIIKYWIQLFLYWKKAIFCKSCTNHWHQIFNPANSFKVLTGSHIYS